MNQGIQILIARMKDHPEEFYDFYEGGFSRWRFVFQNLDAFTDFEREEWDKGLKEVEAHKLEARRDKLTEIVMQELAGVRYDINEDNQYKEFTRPSNILTPKAMAEQSLELLKKSFSEEYAKYKPDNYGTAFNLGHGVQTK
jgi:hypothetical protein